jgi:hypothetical protein
MVDPHEDYVKLSEKIDSLCESTRTRFDIQIERVHERIDRLSDVSIRFDERQKHLETVVIKHMDDEDKRWKIIVKVLIFLGVLHLTELATSYPQIIAMLKAIGL